MAIAQNVLTLVIYKCFSPEKIKSSLFHSVANKFGYNIIGVQ